MKATLYHAAWCGPCAVLKDAIAKDPDLASAITLVDVDKSAKKADKASIQAVPTLIREDGVRIEGARTAKALRKWLSL